MTIDHDSISSHHCEMVLTEDGHVLVDVGSTNGIRLNEERMENIPLANGSEAKIGDIIFNYDLSEEELAVPAAQPEAKTRSNAIPAPPNPPRATPTVLASSKNSAGKDFAIFVVVTLLALGAFWQGLNSAHKKATKAEDNRYGNTLWSDISGKNKPEATEEDKES